MPWSCGLQTAHVGGCSLPSELLAESSVWLGSDEILQVHAEVVLFQCSALLKEHSTWWSCVAFFSFKS